MYVLGFFYYLTKLHNELTQIALVIVYYLCDTYATIHTHKTTPPPPSFSKRKKINTGKTSSMSNTAYKRHNQISLPFKNVHTVAKKQNYKKHNKKEIRGKAILFSCFHPAFISKQEGNHAALQKEKK